MKIDGAESAKVSPLRRAVKYVAITLGAILACVGSLVLWDPLGEVHESFPCRGFNHDFRFDDTPITRAPRFGIVGEAECSYAWEFDRINTTRTVSFRTSLDAQTIIRQAVAFCRREGFETSELTERGVDCDKHQLMLWIRLGEADPKEVVYIEMEHTL